MCMFVRGGRWTGRWRLEGWEGVDGCCAALSICSGVDVEWICPVTYLIENEHGFIVLPFHGFNGREFYVSCYCRRHSEQPPSHRLLRLHDALWDALFQLSIIPCLASASATIQSSATWHWVVETLAGRGVALVNPTRLQRKVLCNASDDSVIACELLFGGGKNLGIEEKMRVVGDSAISESSGRV